MPDITEELEQKLLYAVESDDIVGTDNHFIHIIATTFNDIYNKLDKITHILELIHNKN